MKKLIILTIAAAVFLMLFYNLHKFTQSKLRINELDFIPNEELLIHNNNTLNSFLIIVVDQNENPISNAEIEVVIYDKPTIDGRNLNRKYLQTNSNGIILINEFAYRLQVFVRFKDCIPSSRSLDVLDFSRIPQISPNAKPFPLGNSPVKIQLICNHNKPCIKPFLKETDITRFSLTKHYILPSFEETHEARADLTLQIRLNKSKADCHNWCIYPYYFEARFPGGGIINDVDEYDFVAPDSGYLENITINCFDDIRECESGLDLRIIYKTRNNHYGKGAIRLRWTHNRSNNPYFSFEGIHNICPDDQNLFFKPNAVFSISRFKELLEVNSLVNKQSHKHDFISLFSDIEGLLVNLENIQPLKNDQEALLKQSDVYLNKIYAFLNEVDQSELLKADQRCIIFINFNGLFKNGRVNYHDFDPIFIKKLSDVDVFLEHLLSKHCD